MGEKNLNEKNSILLTIFLRHDQSKTLAEIGDHLGKTDFWKKFPPRGLKSCPGT